MQSLVALLLSGVPTWQPQPSTYSVSTAFKIVLSESFCCCLLSNSSRPCCDRVRLQAIQLSNCDAGAVHQQSRLLVAAGIVVKHTLLESLKWIPFMLSVTTTFCCSCRMLCSQSATFDTCYEAQHSTAQHSASQHSTARHGTARHGTARHGTARHGMEKHSARNFRDHT